MRPHAFDPLSFVSGLVLVTVALVTLAGGFRLDVSFDVAWIAPVLLLGAGIAMLLSIGSTRRRSAAAERDLAVAGTSATDADDWATGWDDPAGEPVDESANEAANEPDELAERGSEVTAAAFTDDRPSPDDTAADDAGR